MSVAVWRLRLSLQGRSTEAAFPCREARRDSRTAGATSRARACRSVAIYEVRRHGHVPTPGRYVGAEPPPDDGAPFEHMMQRLMVQWRAQQAEAQTLDAAIATNLTEFGFGDQ